MTNSKDIGALLREAYDLKERQNEIKARLAEINGIVAGEATFRDGCRTSHVAANGISAKISLKETVSWDQDALKTAFDAIGPQEFRKAFKYEFSPVSSAALKNWMASPDTSDEARRLVDEARTVKVGSPSVSYSLVEEV